MFRSYVIALMVALSCAPALAAPDASQPAPQSAPPVAASQPATPQRTILPVDAPQNKLHLTAEQQQKMYAILDQARGQAMAIQNDAKASAADKKTQFTTLQNKVQQQELGVMTPPQQIAAKRHLSEQAKYMASIRQLALQRQQLQQKLTATITPAQKQKITAIQTTMQAYATTLQSDKTLTDDQRSVKFKSKLEGAEQKMTAVLNPSQHALLNKLNSVSASLVVAEKLYQDAGI